MGQDLTPLLGLPLAEAQKRLLSEGLVPHVVESLAPRAQGDRPGVWRVARARQEGDELELVAVLAPILPE